MLLPYYTGVLHLTKNLNLEEIIKQVQLKHNIGIGDDDTELEIRLSLMEDAMNITTTSTFNPRKSLKVCTELITFEDERGVDDGGLTREFFLLLC